MSGLVGRAPERGALERVVATAESGRGACIVIEAEAGLGKSTLLADTYAHLVTSEGCFAEADEMEQARPFGVVLRALGCSPKSADERRRLVSSLLRGSPLTGTDQVIGGPAGDRFVVQDAIEELVEELASERPLVIMIDDAQWADASSLGALSALVRQTRSLPVAIVIACRPWPRPPELEALIERIRRADGDVLRLDGMTDADVGDLVRTTVNGEPSARLMAAVEAAAGNPFYVCELLRHADAGGRLVRDGPSVELDGELTTEPFLDRVVRRLDAMEPVTRNLLRVASLYGPHFDLRDLAALLDESVMVLEQVTTEARRAGLLRTSVDGRLAFAHDLVREAISADLPSTVSAALHRDIANSLIARHAPVQQVAPHLVIGAQVGDLVAVDWLEQAALETAAVDPIGAEQLLAKAQALAPPNMHTRLMADRARMLKWAGKVDDAAALANEALATRPDAAITLRLRIELAESDLLKGRSRDALAPLLAAAEDESISEKSRAHLWAEVAAAAMWTLDFALCERAADQAITMAGDEAPTARALAHGLLSRRYAFSGDLLATTRHALLAAEFAQSYQPTARSVPMFYAGLGLVWTDPVHALEVLQQGLRLAEKQGLTWSQPVYYQGLVSAAFDAGVWDDALIFYETGSAIEDELAELGEPSITAFIGLIHIARDEIDLARQRLAEATRAMDAPNARYGSWLYIRWLEAYLMHHDGDTPGAGARLLEAVEFAGQFGAPNAAVTLAADGVEWSDPNVDRDRMERVTLAMEELAEIGQAPIQQATALRCRAALDGRPELAVEAVRVLEPTSRRRDLIQTYAAAGAALVRAGDHSAARPVLEQGLAVAEQLGAGGLERSFRSMLRTVGAPSGVRNQRRRARSGWESLTETELLVVRLVRDGLTNAEIGLRLLISRRTVDTHLVNVYRKLGLSSRVALAARVAEQLGTDQTLRPAARTSLSV